MKRVSILGLGLMGGSLGLALGEGQRTERVTGYARRAETRDRAVGDGAVDAVFADPAAAVDGADLVVVCVPIQQTAAVLEAAREGLKPGCLVTDVGSTKAVLATELPAVLEGTGARFVGSHPIAGSDEEGLAAARKDLYRNAVVVVTPSDPVRDRQDCDQLGDFWEGVGARVLEIHPTLHDEVLARTSHLPHMISCVLAATVGRDPDAAHVSALCGTGFRDTTRLARGAPAVWNDILATNREPVVEELRAFRARLDELIGWMEGRDGSAWTKFLEQARDARQRLDGRSNQAR